VAVECAREVFDMAQTAGFQFSLLDIGGGFPDAISAATSFNEVTFRCLKMKIELV